MSDVEIYEDGFAELGKLVRRNLMEPWKDAVVADAKRLAPRDTGRLVASIEGRITSDFDAEVGSPLDYAASVEMGARPHLIPHAFGRPGAVHHPGNPPQPYLRPAAYMPRYGND